MNNLLDMLSKAAEEAVDAAQTHNASSEQKAVRPDMLYQESTRQSKRITPLKPISLSAAAPKQEAVTMVGLTPIQATLDSVTRVGLTPIEMPAGFLDERSLGASEAPKPAQAAPQTYSEAFSDLDAELNDQVQELSPQDVAVGDDSGFSIELDFEDVSTEFVSEEAAGAEVGASSAQDSSEAEANAQNQAIIDYANALRERVSVLEGRLKEALQRSEEAESRAAQLQDKVTRAAADFDNYRKRVMRDQEQFKAQAKEKIVSEFLSVMDNFERAIQHARVSNNFDNLFHGVELTAKLFTQALAKQGCQSFESVGQQFDPNYHDVLSRVESSETPHNTIVQEHLKGYLMNDHLLRPALVVVSQHPEEQGADRVTDQDSGTSEGLDESVKE